MEIHPRATQTSPKKIAPLRNSAISGDAPDADAEEEEERQDEPAARRGRRKRDARHCDDGDVRDGGSPQRLPQLPLRQSRR